MIAVDHAVADRVARGTRGGVKGEAPPRPRGRARPLSIAFCTKKALPFFRTHTAIPFEELILRIFRSGGFLR
jgi:hypothetical protein